MNDQSLGDAPSYRCPGCHAELSVGDATLEHLNRCAAIRGMIASGSGYVVRNTETVSGKKALRGGDPQSNIGEKATTRRSDWKVHGPVVSVPVEENTTSTKMKLPAPIKEKTVKPTKEKTVKPRIRKHSLKPHRLFDTVMEKMALPNLDRFVPHCRGLKCAIFLARRHCKIFSKRHTIVDIRLLSSYKYANHNTERPLNERESGYP